MGKIGSYLQLLFLVKLHPQDYCGDHDTSHEGY